MEDKDLQKRNKRNQNVRNILLSSIIVLFITFVVFFIFSYIQYKSIQNKIQNIYTSVNSDQNNFTELLTIFSEAEDHFRLFSITYNINDYNSYRSKLITLKSAVDSLIKVRSEESKTFSDKNYHGRKLEDLLPKYSQLNSKLDSILVASETLKTFNIQANNETNISIPRPKEPAPIVANEPKKVVVKKKSLLKRIFQKGDDTITVETGTPTHTQQVTEQNANLKNIIKQGNTQAENRLKELKQTLTDIRKNERSLLADNFTLLHSANQLIRIIHEERIQIQRDKTDHELSILIARTDTFKWQIIISLTFVFIVICILVYYQFFTNYYERKLLDERVYASKLAEQKTDILAEITHEIRTPINSLIGIVDLLKSRKDLYQANDIHLLESAYTNITATSKTINDILNLSKIDQQNSIEAIHFDFVDLLIDVVETHRNHAEMKGIELAYELDKNQPTVIFSDEFKVRQIMSNLVSNAIKYSNGGKVVASAIVDDQSNLIFKVSDQGQGIPDALKKNIFKKYYTVNKSNKVEGGVGLGLYITKNIVSTLKGKINFKTNAGQGTTFKVEIPIPKPKFRRKTSLNIEKISDFSKDLSWLIVDDNALNLLYLKQFFSLHTHVKTATNGKEALEILSRFPIDVVVTDINMPVMTGDELLATVRANPAYNSVKIIATSSDNEQVKNLEKERQVLFDGILIKPFNERKLTEVIVKTIYPIFEDSDELRQES